MLKANQRLEIPTATSLSITLPFELRQKSRLRARLDGSGEEVAIMLDRGRVLRHGDCVQTESGEVIAIHAAEESLSMAASDSLQGLARVAYHLGNRHVPLQVGDGWVRYQQDHVLDEMVRQLGLTLSRVLAPFEPEAGAYGAGHGHAHGEQAHPFVRLPSRHHEHA